MTSKRVFISYKRNTELDQPLAEALFNALSGAGHSVFIDRSMQIGEDWVKRIAAEVEASDYLLLLLSEQSVQSSMVAEEVRIADKRRKASGKSPAILPVRVAFEGSLPYDLGAILNRLNYALWRGPEDSGVLVGDLLKAIESERDLPAPSLSGVGLDPEIPLPAANPCAPLEAPEGTMPPDSPFYIARSADSVVDDELNHKGYTLTIQAPRQMGKSSMLGRVMHRAREIGKKKVAFVDFQAFGHEQLGDPETLYRQFSFLIEDALELDSELDRHWSVPLAPAQKCRRFMERRILPACGPSGLLLALDEADALLDAKTSSDFFGMLRSWHNERALKPAWQAFSLAMVISTEPSMLIEVLSQSPFNVGTIVKPEDFTVDETLRVHSFHGSPLNDGQLDALHKLLAGHPYLTRKALYLLSKRRYGPDELLNEADSESGPFGDHLRALLTRLMLLPGLADALRTAVRSGSLSGRERHRLIAGGLIKERSGRLVARNPLYDSYFRRVL